MIFSDICTISYGKIKANKNHVLGSVTYLKISLLPFDEILANESDIHLKTQHIPLRFGLFVYATLQNMALMLNDASKKKMISNCVCFLQREI